VKPREIFSIVAVAIVAGAAAFYIAGHATPPPAPVDEVTWLIEEFQLSAAQADTVRALHEAYAPICQAHCDAVMEAQRGVEAAENPSERAVATEELMRLKDRCHIATQAHVEAVAAVMSPEQGQRYLEMISPLLSAHGHQAPFGLR
jgi:hypothetical protein